MKSIFPCFFRVQFEFNIQYRKNIESISIVYDFFFLFSIKNFIADIGGYVRKKSYLCSAIGEAANKGGI